MALCDLTKALALAAIALDSGVVQFQWVTSDVTPFETGAPQAGTHPFDDQVALKFGDGADDDNDGPAQRPFGIDIFPELDELDLEPVQFVQYFQKVLHRPGDPIRSPDQNNIEPAMAGVGHHQIETGPFGLGAAGSIGVLVDDLIAALRSHLAQVEQLCFRVLIDSRDPHVESGALHARLLFFCGVVYPCLATYFSMNSISTVVISTP